MAIVSVSLDKGILEELDRIARSRKYRSRSEAVREAVREFINVDAWRQGSGRTCVILAVIYDKSLQRASLAALQHRFDEIRTSLHTHLDKGDCLQIFVAEGTTARLKDLITEIRRIRGMKQTKFVQTAVSS
jgi:CopG family nickel-responsive transcriptional regulator